MDRQEAQAILDKYKIKDQGDLHGLTGGRRAQIRVAWNWLQDNPEQAAPKRSRKKKTTD